MKAAATKNGVSLWLTDEEALCLAAMLGRSSSEAAPLPDWYDPLADVIEAKTERTQDDEVVYDRISDMIHRSEAASRVYRVYCT